MEKYFVTRVLSLLSEKLTIRVIKCRLCNSDISENFFFILHKKDNKKKKQLRSATMFPNILAPSPLYQSLFRNGQLVPQAPMVTTSASFLVENLLRDRNQALLARQSLPPFTCATTFSPTLPENLQATPVTSSASLNAINPAPYLKFGVNAILGREPSSPKSGKVNVKSSSFPNKKEK